MLAMVVLLGAWPARAAGPVAALAVGDPDGLPPLQTTFDTSGSRLDAGQTAALHLLFPGNGDVLVPPAASAPLVYTYAFAGFYLAGSWLSESPSGLAGVATPVGISVLRVSDGQAPPQLDLVLAPQANAPLTVAFMPLVTAAAGDPEVARRWDFGDGTFGGQAAPQHAYAQAGVYQAALLSTTRSGLVASARVLVALPAADGSLPPSLLVGITPAEQPPGTPLQLQAFVAATAAPTVESAHVDWPGLEDAAPTVTMTATGVLVSSPFSFATPGRYDVPVTVALQGLPPLTATGHVTVVDGIRAPSPALLAPPSASATVGQPYEPSGAGAAFHRLPIAGDGPFAFAVVAPSPPGFAIDSDGNVRWTPAAAESGDQRLAVTVTDRNGQSLPLSWVVTVAGAHGHGCAAIPGAASAGEIVGPLASLLVAVRLRRRSGRKLTV